MSNNALNVSTEQCCTKVNCLENQNTREHIITPLKFTAAAALFNTIWYSCIITPLRFTAEQFNTIGYTCIINYYTT